MSEAVWYVYQQGQQLGPFSPGQVTQMLSSNMISQDGYLFKVGWKDWRPLEETYEELGLKAPPAAPPPSPDRRSKAPRATISGRVVVHNNGHLAIGAGVNISMTGIFVETSEQIFTVGESLKLSVRVDGMAKAFNAVAQVIRFNADPRFPVGFGLQFENLDPHVRDEIEKLVNQRGSGKSNRHAS